jgi:hypothetical protein
LLERGPIKGETNLRYTAVYVDQENAQWSCPVTKTEQGFMLATAHGARPIDFYLPEPDAAGGFLAFHDYRLDGAPNGLRGCDFTQLVDQMYKALPWPHKPMTAPTPTYVEPDGRLHIEPRQQGESSFRQLQRANAARIEEERQNRLQARTEVQNVAANRDVADVAAAQELNSQILRQIRPRGSGVGIVVTPAMTQSELEVVLKKRR